MAAKHTDKYITNIFIFSFSNTFFLNCIFYLFSFAFKIEVVADDDVDWELSESLHNKSLLK